MTTASSPLAAAEPVQVCIACRVPTRDGHLSARTAGPGWEAHAHPTRRRETARGGLDRCLRVVRSGPQVTPRTHVVLCSVTCLALLAALVLAAG